MKERGFSWWRNNEGMKNRRRMMFGSKNLDPRWNRRGSKKASCKTASKSLILNQSIADLKTTIYFWTNNCFQLTRWIFLCSKEESQINPRMAWLMELVVTLGKGKHCIIYMGMEERTDLARVIRPTKFNNFDFHELSLAIIELRIGWKSRDKGLRLRIEIPSICLSLECRKSLI